MKKARLKVLLTSILSTGAVLAPIAATVSCGNNTKYDLTIGIRPEDQPLWNSVASQFEKATGKKVGFRWVADQNNDYTAWSASGLMPDVTIADSGWAKTGMSKNWFQKVDLSDIATNQAYRITGQDDKYAEVDKTFDGTNFEKAMLDTMKADVNNYNGLAVIYGPHISYAWKKIPTTTPGQYIDLYDGQTKLEWFVPKTDGSIEKVDDFDRGNATSDHRKPSPLYSTKSDHHRLMNNETDVQEFLTNSANQEDLEFNGDPTATNIDSAKSRVLATGTLGYNQRLASVSKVIFDALKAKTTTLANGQNLNNLKAAATADSAIPYTTLAYGEQLTQKTETNVEAAHNHLDNNNYLKDNEVFVNDTSEDTYKINFSKKTGNAGTSKLSKLLYYGNLGYFHKGMFGNSHVLDGDDQQVGFAKLKSLFINGGALWMWGGIKEKVEATFPGQDADKLLTSFGQPMQVTGVDGYALKSGLAGEKLTLAKKFLRFLMQNQAAADITGSKAISTVKGAQGFQPTIEGARHNGLDANGVKDIPDGKVIGNNTIPLIIAKSSSATGNLNGKDNNPIFDPYNDFWMKGTAFNSLDYTGDIGLTYSNMTSAFDTYNTKYMESLEV